MRFISITKSINIRLDWANITGTVLKAGTPISLTGVVANTADAVGILSQDVGKSDAVVAVVTEGTIDLGEIAASYGELDDAAISAMHGITFIDDGEPVAPGELPAVTSDDKDKFLHTNGSTGALEWAEAGGGGSGVFVVNNTYDSGTHTWSRDKTNAEIAAAHDAGQLIVMRRVDASYPFNAIASVTTQNGNLTRLTAFASAIEGPPTEIPDVGYAVAAWLFNVRYASIAGWKYDTSAYGLMVAES